MFCDGQRGSSKVSLSKKRSSTFSVMTERDVREGGSSFLTRGPSFFMGPVKKSDPPWTFGHKSHPGPREEKYSVLNQNQIPIEGEVDLRGEKLRSEERRVGKECRSRKRRER